MFCDRTIISKITIEIIIVTIVIITNHIVIVMQQCQKQEQQ